MSFDSILGEQLVHDLGALGLERGMTLLMHSSLRRLGWVENGARTVVEALLAVLGPEGTLMVPTHTTHLMDPASWANPRVPPEWWESIRAQLLPFDVATTPSWCMGAIAETVRKWPGARRSVHPLHSFAAVGRRAEVLTQQVSLDQGLGERSPLARLEQLGGSILLLGVDHSSNTTLHLAEYRARWPGKKLMTTHAPMVLDGVAQWVAFDELEHQTDDFRTFGHEWVAHAPRVLGQVGHAKAELMPARAVLEFAVPWFEAHRGTE